MAVVLQSTKAKVRDPQKVREILDDFELDYVEIELHEDADGWTLAMEFEDGDPDEGASPLALHRDQWPDEKRYPDDYVIDDLEETEWDRRFEEQGAEGFVTLLRQLAPHLETPLVILLANAYSDGVSADMWRVPPGAQGKRIKKHHVF